MSMNPNVNRGFSLLEIIVVLVITSTIAMALIPLGQYLEDKKRLDFAEQQVSLLHSSLNKYYLAYCGQAIFPQPSIETLLSNDFLTEPFTYPALVESIDTAVRRPNSPRATASVTLNYNPDEAIEGDVERYLKKLFRNSAAAERVGEKSIEYRSLMLLNSTSTGYRLRENQSQYQLDGC